jgi:magnesium-transporting ATPase (P-type)
MGFLKKKEVADERIEIVKNKIYKETFWASIAISIISIIVKFYLYGINTGSVITEFSIIIVLLFYRSARSVSLGIYSDEIELHDRKSKLPMNIKNIISGLGSGFAIAMFFGIRSAVVYGSDGNRMWYFVLVFLASLAIYCPFFIATIMAMHRIAKGVSERASKREQ